MWPLIVFPDAEAWATEWLSSQVAQQESYGWAPLVAFDNVIPRDTDRPAYMVVVSRDGGPTLEHHDEPRLRFNVWAPSDQEADEMTRVLGGLLLVARTDPKQPVVAAVVNGAIRVPDGTGGARRAFWASLKTIAIQGD